MMYPYYAPAIKVKQKLGDFFVVSLPASILLDTCHSVKVELLEDEDNVQVSSLGKLVDGIRGTQRPEKLSRLEEIRRYSETVDACFPNSIILGANFDESGMLVSDEEKRWSIEPVDDDYYKLCIPTKEKMASIIDGQHRIFGFKNSKNKEMELPCSVFIDLPMPFHAHLFTKINTTQKRVDKNLAYNLFQFDMDQGDSKSWSPETLAVYFARVLASDDESPLKGNIKIGLVGSNVSSTISMASIIDGILNLITSNAEKDRSELHTVKISDGRSRKQLANMSTKAPLRQWYLKNQDKTLYEFVLHYFKAVDKVFWRNASESNILNRTLGVQALLDFLKSLAAHKGIDFSYGESYFLKSLEGAKEIDFKQDFYGVQSKVRSRIRNTLLVTSGLKSIEELASSEEDKESLRKICRK